MLEPEFADYAGKISRSFAKQAVMKLIGAELDSVAAGEVIIRLPFRNDLTQQDGFLHAGISTTICDSACGYAALSMMSEESQVLSVEFKVNLLSPAIGDFFEAQGSVVRSGRNLTVVRGEVFAVKGETRKIILSMLGTMMRIESRNQI